MADRAHTRTSKQLQSIVRNYAENLKKHTHKCTHNGSIIILSVLRDNKIDCAKKTDSGIDVAVVVLK